MPGVALIPLPHHVQKRLSPEVPPHLLGEEAGHPAGKPLGKPGHVGVMTTP